jgi:choline dehydrogenase
LNSNPEFDYVIAGAGSAGCVLAARLAEDPSVSVCVIEAGGPATGLFRDMPLAFPIQVRRRELNWNFLSEPEPHLNNRVIEVPRGKALGGSSTINGMVYARGHRLDYDDWARRGLAGWSYADVLPYFRRTEKSWLGEGPYHGGSGPLAVCVPPDARMFANLRAAALAAGCPDTDDYHGRRDEGAQRSEMTVSGGRRGDTARLFLNPARNRGNLTVMTHCLATRILFNGRRATGIEVLRGGGTMTLHARREVILAGGTYGSPQLLMLSGIGPAGELAQHGIRPLADLPGVGRNLIEHPFVYMGWHARHGSYRCELRIDRAIVSVLRWAFAGTGPFATNGLAGNVFIRTLPELDRPDLQLTCISPGMSAGRVWLPLPWKKPDHVLPLALSMIRQDSRGNVTLRSADPLAPPRIRFNLMQERPDVERMIRCIRTARRVYDQEPLRRFHLAETTPGDGLQSDRELETFIRATAAITQHAVGTCRMGPDGDHGAVVDAQLRVRGLEGLRVIDASIMPDVPGGNTNAPTIMIAEKGADLLRGRSLPPAQNV